MTDPRQRPPLASVAAISSAALATEILLSRTFAVVHWHHYAFMIISLALLGHGASGTFLALVHDRLRARLATAYLASAAAFGALTLASPVLAGALPLQAEALPWDPRQPLWLVLTYLVLSMPFFCAATAIGLALLAFHDRAGRVYAADLVGAGLGSVAVLALLYRLWPEDVLRVAAATGFVSVALGALELGARPRAWAAVAALGVGAAALVPDATLRLEPGPYKGLSQALRIEGTRVLLERSGPLGRITVIESPLAPLRHAPGLSLMSTSEPPPQLGLFTDGDALQAVTGASADPARLAFLGETTSALAYRVSSPRAVLVPAAAGGLEVLRAVRLGARRVDALELDPVVAGLLRDELDAHTGGLFRRPEVELHVGEPRGFLARTGRRYDLVQLSLLGAGGGGGLGGLNEDYLHTVEAFRLLLDHLEPGGYLSITRWVDVPPRDGLKLVATVVAALEANGVTGIADRLLAVRGWQTVTLLVKNGAVSPAEVERLRAFCDRLAFDPLWFPGVRPEETNRWNLLPEGSYHEEVRALLGPDRARLVAGYRYDIRPATDDRPYFQNFFRWPALVEALAARGRGGMALLEAGYLVLVATLAQAIVAGLLLVLLPLLLLRRSPPRGAGPRWRVLAYFLSLGLAFMFLEVAFLQKLVLSLHHPTVALAVVLATFLLPAGLGSALASRQAPHRARRALVLAVAGIAILGALNGLGFDAVAAATAAWPTAARAATAAVLIAPLAFCMGMPFPLALRELDGSIVPWAWGINGCASVVGATLATVLAVDLGFAALLWLALALYLAALATAPGPAVRADVPG